MLRNTAIAFVGLGSNMGDAEANLIQALERIRGLSGVTSVIPSSVYLTEPQGLKDQPWFANMVARLECAVDRLGPEDLMRALLAIESSLGRVRTLRNGPRVIDLDLLMYGQAVMDTPVLTLPHPRITERAFVLVPLLELAPDLILPDGTKCLEALRTLEYTIAGRKICQ